MKELKKHFIRLEKNGLVKIWEDSQIGAGIEIWKEVNSEFNKADIVLLLLSVDYLNSDSCVNGELMKALVRREHDECFRVIPIILRFCDWHQFENLGKYKALPHDGMPVAEFKCADKAYMQIIQSISDILEKGCSVQLGDFDLPSDNLTLKILYNILVEEKDYQNKGFCLVKDKKVDTPFASFSFPYNRSKRKYNIHDDFNETEFNQIVEKLINGNWLDGHLYTENTEAYNVLQYKLNLAVDVTLYASKIIEIFENGNIKPEFMKILTPTEQIQMCADINKGLSSKKNTRYFY